MTTQLLPPEISVIQDGLDSTRFILPRRKLGSLRWFGLVPLIFGLGLSGFMFTWMSGPLRGIGDEHGFARVFSIVFALFGLPGLVVGVGLVLLGIVIILEGSSSEVALSGGDLRAIERCGLLRWTRKRPLASIRRLTKIDSQMSGPSTGPVSLAALSVGTSDGVGLLMAAGYPASLLEPLAQALSAALSESRLATSFDPGTDDEPDYGDPPLEQPITMGVAASPRDAAAADDRIMAPPDTDITVQPHAEGIAITIPPAGLKSGSRILLLIGLVFAALPCLFGFAIVNSHQKPPLVALIFLAVFLLVGVFMILAAINMSRSRTLLAITNESLAFRTTGPFRTTGKAIPRREITFIRMGPSGTEVNHVPVMELQIGHSLGKITGLLSQRSETELLWLGAELRRTLKVGKDQVYEDARVPDEAMPKPPNSRITLQEQAGGVAISVPRAGLWKGSKGLFMFSLLWNGFIVVFITLMAHSRAPIGLYLFMLIFVAAGLAMLGSAINMGCKRILLAVAHETLAYQTDSPFGRVQRQFHRNEIASIGVGPSGLSVGNNPVLELQLHLVNGGAKVGLLSSCSAEECAWVAAVLRQHLHMAR